MNAYVPFTETRKSLIAHVKGMLTSADLKPYKDPTYGTKYRRLYLGDYALYAALRGADFRKTSHLRAEGAPNAREALDLIAKNMRAVIENPKSLLGHKYPQNPIKRYVIGLNQEAREEMIPVYLERATTALHAIEAALNDTKA